MIEARERAVAAWRALQLVAVDPGGLGGLWLRARAGDARDAFLSELQRVLAPRPFRRLAPGLAAETLFGGLDLTASLAAGRPRRTAGLVDAAPCACLAPMAERMGSREAALLAQALDETAGGDAICLILLDEAASPDEAAPAKLIDRLAFFVDLEGLSMRELRGMAAIDLQDIEAARSRVATVEISDEFRAELTAVAAALGAPDLRAPLLAIRAARAAAALSARSSVMCDDAQLAAALVLGPRGNLDLEKVEPQVEATPPRETPDHPRAAEEQAAQTSSGGQGESLVAAARAALPPGLLDHLSQGASGRPPRRATEGGGRAPGQKAEGRRGRPAPSRRGRLDGRRPIDLIATLRCAAPWQALRRRAAVDDKARAVLIRPEDIRLKRCAERRERAILFVVDASGSTALARLGEAKGAVELLLGEAYARRDHVGLIAFRGAGADALLPPTRSLVAAKRRLAALPSGGGTPLAAGLVEALRQVETAARRGVAANLVLLTDGRANLTLSGVADRAAAASEAREAARQLRAAGAPCVVVDTARRPQPEAEALADALGGEYLPLPHADAQRLSAAANAALP